MPLLRMWVHCPRALNGLLPRRSNLVGYARWDARNLRQKLDSVLVLQLRGGVLAVLPSFYRVATSPTAVQAAEDGH
jgi:hypothetical protein